MKILVTGGCGYKGSVLVPKLLAKGYEVIVVDIQWFGNSLTSHPNLTVIKGDIRFLQTEWLHKVNAIIHLASVANDPCCELDSKLSWEIGPLATLLLVEEAIKQGVTQFIYASSGSVYGVNDQPQVTENLPLKPISDYNKTKMVSERVLLSYQDKILIQIIRPATVCGYSPRMRFDVSVNMMTMQALTHGLMTVFGGDQVRPNIHIEDITDLYVFLLEQKEKIQGVYNAGFENLSILNIAHQVKNILPDVDIKVTPSNDPRSYRLNSDKLLKTGYAPNRTVNNAISELIQLHKKGILHDSPLFHNLATMKELAI